MMQLTVANPRFPSGHLAMTDGVARLAKEGKLFPLIYLGRHLNGDWGDIGDGDRRRNNAALEFGEARLFSSYQVAPELTLWIITEWDRSVTTLLLPSEY
ncbi:putative type I restriction-modification system methyltransferase subunit [Burkholderia pseudomallei]|nr:putative type I restriction-modification system methyltransferase subunit [Burkholderia pseudomallei]